MILQREEVKNMNRMDRLMAILIALQQGNQTAAGLAAKLEVSRRTILRDMQALSEMGIPLAAVSGPQGGYYLMEGYQLPPLQLNSREALCLLFALEGLTRYADTPFNSERWTVLDKIKAILPRETAETVHPMLDRLEVEVPKRKYTVPHLNELLDYASRNQWVSVFYQSMNHRRRLLIHPLRIYAANGFWYCDAYSQAHGEQRIFRIDRMSELRPEDPPEAGVSDGGRHQGKSDPQTVHIRAKLTYRGMLQVERDEHVGERIRAIGNEEWLADFHLPVSEWHWAVQLFYSLGTEAEVLEPEALRREVCTKAARLLAAYESDHT